MAIFLRMKSLTEKTGLSRSSIYAMVARGEFPQPIRLGARASAWNADEVEKWQAERLAAGWTPLPRINPRAAA